MFNYHRRGRRRKAIVRPGQSAHQFVELREEGLFDNMQGQEGSRVRRVLKGKVYGKTIELEADPHLPEGEEVEVEVRVNRLAHLERAFGGWHDDPDLDRALEGIDRDRHQARVGRA
jgi:hypothetical protein